MRLRILALALFFSAFAGAQEYTVITATNVQVDNGSGTAINPPSGTDLCFTGVNNLGATITYTPSGGSPVSGPVCQTLNSSGALTGTLQVANPATASPNGLYYTITVVNGSTTYLTIPIVTLSGSLFAYNGFVLPGFGTALGIGAPHLLCAGGASWTSTTFPSGQQNFNCGNSGTWNPYPTVNYCPSGTSYLVPQGGGTAFCIGATISGNGSPSGLCTNNSLYIQQNASPGANLWPCVNGAWVQEAGGITLPVPIAQGGTGANNAAAADYALAGNPGTGVFARNCTSGSPGTCTSTAITSNSTYVNLQYLYNFHSALSTILQNGTLNTTAAVWTMACDSWCSNGYITAPLRAQMQLQYGNGGAGYTNFASLSSYVPDWTLTGTWTSYSSDLYSLDGYSIGSSDTSTPATATLSACTTYRYAVIHYEAGSYTFAWQVDSGGWNNVNASGSGYQTVATTATAGCHILAIKMVSGSSIISGTSGGIKGVDFQNSGSPSYVQAGGFRLNSLGHPGWTAANVVALDPTHWEAGMTALGSNLFTLQFGVNEQGANTPPATQIANYTTIISEAKAATPLIDIGMDPPSESGVTATYTIGQYAAAQEAFAVANNYAFWNTYQVMGPYATQNSLNERSNTQHLNQLGGQAFANVMTSDPTDPITLWSPTFLGATVNTNLQNQGYTICLQSTYCQHLYATHSISAGTGNSMYFSVSNGSGNPAANFYHYGNGTSLFPGTMTVDDAGQNVGYSATYGNSYPQNIQATFSNAVAGNNCWLFQNFNLSAAATAFKTCGDLSALFYGKVTVDTSSQNAGLTTTDGGAYPQTILGTFSNAVAGNNCWNIGNWNLSSTVTVLTTCGDLSTNLAGAFKMGGNTIFPAGQLTGYHGNSSGVKVPLATNWTNTAGAVLCDDGNGNLTITACTIPVTIVGATTFTVNSSTFTLSGNRNYAECSTTCTVTLPTPAAGVELCVRNTPGTSTAITLAALGSGNYYELTTHAGYGTANHTLVSGGATTDQICLVGHDANHYDVFSYSGTWTD